VSPQKVGIYIGPQTDPITCQRNHFEGNLKHVILDESKSVNNKLESAAPAPTSIE